MPENNSDDIEKLLDQVDQLNRLNEQLLSTIDNTGKSLSGNVFNMRSMVSEANRNLQASKQDYKNKLQIIDTTEAIAEAKRKIAHHESQSSVLSGYFAQVWRDNLKTIQDFTDEQEKSVKLQEMAVDSADELANSIMGIFDKFPIGGKFMSRALGVDEIKSSLSKDLTQNFKAFFNTGEMTAGNLKNVFLKSFDSIGKALKNAFSPFTLIAILAIAAIARFGELDKAAGEFRKTIGFTVSQTYELSNNIRTISRDLRDFGVRAEDIYKSAAAIANEFDNVAFITKDLLKTSSLLSANYGIGEETTAKTVQNFMKLSGESAETASNLAKSTVVAAKFAGVAPKKVMEDIANASETTLVMMRGNAKEMARTALEARILGTNLESVTKSARSMLNFQESISAEMEAATLLGRNLNFQASRQAAFEGDALRARELALDQIQKAGDLTKMNAFQQEALAKASGMTVDEMQKQLARRRQLNELQASDPAKYARLISAQEKITELNKESVDDEILKMEMQSKQAQMMNQLLAIWSSISDILVPIVDLLASVLLPVLKLIAWGFSIILYPLNVISDLVGSIVTQLKEWKIIQWIAKMVDGLSASTDNLFGSFVKFVAGSIILVGLLSGKFNRLFRTIRASYYLLTKQIRANGIGSAISQSMEGVGEKFSSLFGYMKVSYDKVIDKIKNSKLASAFNTSIVKSKFVSLFGYLQIGYGKTIDYIKNSKLASAFTTGVVRDKFVSLFGYIKTNYHRMIASMKGSKLGGIFLTASDSIKNSTKSILSSISKIGMSKKLTGGLGNGVKDASASISKSIPDFRKSIFTLQDTTKSAINDVSSGTSKAIKSSAAGLSSVTNIASDKSAKAATDMSKNASKVSKSTTGMFSKLNKGIRTMVTTIGKTIQTMARSVGGGLKSLGSGIGKFIDSIFRGIASGLQALSKPNLFVGIAVLLGLSSAVWLTGKAFQEFSGIDWGGVFIGVAALAAFAVAAFAIGSFAPVIALGAAVIGLLGLALIPVAYATKMFAEAMDIAVSSLVGFVGIIPSLALAGGVMWLLASALMAFSTAALFSAIAIPAIIGLSAALLILSATLVPLSLSTKLLSKSLSTIGDSITSLIGVMVSLGEASPMLLKASVTLMSLTGSLVAFGAVSSVLGVFTPLILAAATAVTTFGMALLPAAIFSTILASAFDTAVDSATRFVPTIEKLVDSAPGMFKAALGITALSAAISMLGASQMSSAIGGVVSKLFGGGQSPFEKIIEFSKNSDSIQTSANAVVTLLNSFDGLDSISGGVDKLTKSILNLNDAMAKMSAMKVGLISTAAKITTIHEAIDETPIVYRRNTEKSTVTKEPVNSSTETNKLLSELIGLFKDGSIAVNLDRTKTIGALSAK